MKLLSFTLEGRDSYGAVVADGIVDLGRLMPEYPALVDYIASGAYLKAAEHVAGRKPDVQLSAITYLPVIPKPEKIVCAVRNYMDHHQEVLAAGMQRELSDFPPIFLRVWRSQTAHEQPIVRPRRVGLARLGRRTGGHHRQGRAQHRRSRGDGARRRLRLLQRRQRARMAVPCQADRLRQELRVDGRLRPVDGDGRRDRARACN